MKYIETQRILIGYGTFTLCKYTIFIFIFIKIAILLCCKGMVNVK